MRRQQRGVEVDRQTAGCAGQIPQSCSSAGMRGAQRVDRVGVAGDLIDHPKRRRVRRCPAEQRGLIADHRHVRQTVAAIGKHHCQVPDDAAAIVAASPQLQRAELPRQRPRQAGLVGDLGQQRAAGMRHQARSVRRDFYLHPAPIMRHPQGDPPESALRPSASRRIPTQADSSAAPTIGAATVSSTIRARHKSLTAIPRAPRGIPVRWPHRRREPPLRGVRDDEAHFGGTGGILSTSWHDLL
jgi:hypothetical protein